MPLRKCGGDRTELHAWVAQHSFGIQGINSREGCSQACPLQREKARRLCRVYLVRLTWLSGWCCSLPGCSGDASLGGGPGGKAVSAAGAAPVWPVLLSRCSTSWQAQLALQRCRLSCHWRAALLRVAGPQLLARLRIVYGVRMCQGLCRGRPVLSRGGNEPCGPALAKEKQQQNFLRNRRNVAVSQHAVLDGPGTKHGRLLGKRPGGLLQHTRHSQLCGCESAVQCSRCLVNLNCSQNCLDVDRGSAVEVEKSFPQHWPKKGMSFPLSHCSEAFLRRFPAARLATTEQTTSCSLLRQRHRWPGGSGEPRGARPGRRLCLHALLRRLHLLGLLWCWR